MHVMLVDSHRVLRIGLALLLKTLPEVDAIDEVNSGAEALVAAATSNPQLIVTELNLPDIDSVQLIRRLREQLPESRIVVLTAETDAQRVLSALMSGADAYLLKHAEPPRLIEDVQRVIRGASVLDPDVTSVVLQTIRGGRSWATSAALPGLSRRERDVAALVAEGHTNRAIAERLGLSANTIRFTLKNVYRKLHMSRRTQVAALIAQRRG